MLDVMLTSSPARLCGRFELIVQAQVKMSACTWRRSNIEVRGHVQHRGAVTTLVLCSFSNPLATGATLR